MTDTINPQTDIPVIAVTGGPCAGKTTILAHLQQELADHGVRVLVVPEAARMLMSSGILPSEMPRKAFQKAVFLTQLAHQGVFLESVFKIPAHKSVVLCDRGTMDCVAYMGREAFEEMIGEMHMTVPQVRDGRYDAVIHLVTAANGAEGYYARDVERLETAEEARALDEATQQAWVGHPHLTIIGNETDFEDKKRRVLKQVLHHLGMPIPLEIERKYLVDRACLEHLPGHTQCVRIQQAYLRSSDPEVEERVRKRSEGGSAVYFLTQKRRVRAGVREEIERQISKEEFVELVLSRNVNGVVLKDRYCFLYQGQYFELDDFLPMKRNICMLEVELSDEASEVRLPPWINVIKEVTDDPAYSNREIALGGDDS